MKADSVNTVVFNLHQIKRRAFFGTPSRGLKLGRANSLYYVLLCSTKYAHLKAR